MVALLVQDGALELDRPVGRSWPEFAAAGKGRITVRNLLTHRSGVIGVDGGFTAAELADDQLIARRLAGQRPYWRPGSAYGYGGFVTFAMVGEVVRRATGRSLGSTTNSGCARPTAWSCPWGCRRRWRTGTGRCCRAWPTRIGWRRSGPPSRDRTASPGSATASIRPRRWIRWPSSTPGGCALGQASAGGVGNARALAEMYAALAFGLSGRPPLLEPATLGEFAMLHSTGVDLVTGAAGQYALGFQAKGARYPFLSANAFGHNGSAGSEAFADPVSGIAFGYTRRRFSFDWSYPEHDRLAAAVHHAVTAS
ncbi:serine hydrolase [Amycolatopsis bullii]|uniref:Serine hydrolase n=1 Tax=Amycolatopsis bullii TaxID=941987 RepID=A0ABQ3KDP8_9PSEU|nr:serine hydrolase [Amycolatopsis bullii]